MAAPRYFRAAERRLHRQQRRVSRCKRSSKGRRAAVRQVAKTHEYIANQRRDLAHKLSAWLVLTYGLIAVEDLKVQGLARSRLAKSVSDAAWSQLLAMLDYKVAKTGSQIIRVSPYLTNQICSECRCVVEEDTKIWVHVRPDCGFAQSRCA